MPARIADTPGTGPGWERLAGALRQALPVEEIDGIWVFRGIRSGPRELGTAILSRVDGERRRIYTARYGLMVKGRQRGEFEWGMDEVGSGPLEALEELLALVPARGVDDDPPLPVAPESWFPPEAAPDGESAG
ncbi:MAG: hypothetical protein H6R40_1139 [Gemmatimonadetes bacterium]|nr:hypothetical protein [Gemmatimonadota bacterium]